MGGVGGVGEGEGGGEGAGSFVPEVQFPGLVGAPFGWNTQRPPRLEWKVHAAHAASAEQSWQHAEADATPSVLLEAVV